MNFFTHSRGSGALIAVQAIYDSEQAFVLNVETLEIVFIKIRCQLI